MEIVSMTLMAFASLRGKRKQRVKRVRVVRPNKTITVIIEMSILTFNAENPDLT